MKEIEAEHHDVIILNFANPDMVGHSGMLEPTIKAVEATDECLGKVVEAILAKGGVCLITADHGNADMVIDENGRPHHGTYDEPGSFHRDGSKASHYAKAEFWQISHQRC